MRKGWPVGGRERRAEQIPLRRRPKRDGRLPPNLRSADRSLLTGRAMIHLGIDDITAGIDSSDACSSVLAEGQPRFSRLQEPRDYSVMASVHFFNRHPTCYSEYSGTGHFCPPLAVTREVRPCLHPRGTLRVQSLHLPRWGLARRDLHIENTTETARMQTGEGREPNAQN